MPHSLISTPSYSSSALTRMPTVSLSANHTSQAGAEYPAKDGGSADDLPDEGGLIIGNRNQHQAEQADHAVHRDGAHRVIDFHPVQRQDAEHHQDAAGEPEQGWPAMPLAWTAQR